jgi:oligoribonuclease NrnB/cAMP/cGMP phosphodiesterase (DHH superfamily)
MIFLDLHGHSVKKNVFLYGPDYDIWETNYYKTRMFPKLISNRTEMFRYYSCIFRIA